MGGRLCPRCEGSASGLAAAAGRTGRSSRPGRGEARGKGKEHAHSFSPPTFDGFRWCDPTHDSHCHCCGQKGHIAAYCIYDMPQKVKQWVMRRPTVYVSESANAARHHRSRFYSPASSDSSTSDDDGEHVHFMNDAAPTPTAARKLPGTSPGCAQCGRRPLGSPLRVIALHASAIARDATAVGAPARRPPLMRRWRGCTAMSAHRAGVALRVAAAAAAAPVEVRAGNVAGQAPGRVRCGGGPPEVTARLVPSLASRAPRPRRD
ncbi:hypothetical protein GGG16DRAFT_105315 [Schizophyllum commune]